MMCRLVVGERAHQRPKQKAKRPNDPQLYVEIERKAQTEIAGNDSDQESDEYANQEPHLSPCNHTTETCKRLSSRLYRPAVYVSLRHQRRLWSPPSGILGAKRLELLRQLVPKASTIGMLLNPNTAETESERRNVQEAARAIGQQIIILDVVNDRDFEKAFAALIQHGGKALLVGTGVFMASHRERIVALAARHALPACYALREAVMDGGLMSYGTSIPEAYRQAGLYTARILKGEKPADLPVMLSTKFELLLNLKTAKALNLEIPPTLLALADEVIE